MKPLDFLMRSSLGIAARGKLVILIYHRVHADADALFPNELDARRFDEQMTWVASALNVIPLHDAVEMVREDRLPARAACITFDDGYRDNLDVALPILQRYRFSATIFIASGYLDGGRMWNDTVIEALRRAAGTGIDLGYLGLGQRALDAPGDRRTVIRDVIGELKYRTADARVEQANALARQVGADLPRDLMLRSDEVRSLYAAGMGIGAHTVSHPILARLDDAAARAEISNGRQALEALLGAPVRLFAYPNGKPGADYGDAHVAMVRELDFAAAVSTRPGTSDRSTDRFQLPRYSPWGRSFLRFGVNLVRNYFDRG